MWDEEDGFFYDVLRLPDGQAQRLKVRSMVGLLPLCAATVFDGELLAKYPELAERFQWFLDARPELCAAIHDPTKAGRRRPPARLPSWTRPSSAACWRRCSTRTSSSARTASARCRATTPTIPTSSTPAARNTASRYLPAESDTGMFGGNSNWRGPIWMPVNGLIIRALLQYYTYYGDDFTVECPTGSGRQMNLYQVAEEIARRLANIFLQGQGRPAAGLRRHARSSRTTRTGAICLLFYEYFHGDNGAGLGASHQTGWTGIIARSMHLFATVRQEDIEASKTAYFNKRAEPEIVTSLVGR